MHGGLRASIFHFFSTPQGLLEEDSRSGTGTHLAEQRKCFSAHGPGLLSDWIRQKVRRICWITLSRSALTVRQMGRSDLAGTAIASELMNRFAPNCWHEVFRCEVGTGKACPGAPRTLSLCKGGTPCGSRKGLGKSWKGLGLPEPSDLKCTRLKQSEERRL